MFWSLIIVVWKIETKKALRERRSSQSQPITPLWRLLRYGFIMIYFEQQEYNTLFDIDQDRPLSLINWSCVFAELL